MVSMSESAPVEVIFYLVYLAWHTVQVSCWCSSWHVLTTVATSKDWNQVANLKNSLVIFLDRVLTLSFSAHHANTEYQVSC